jgi:sugar phosphate isomerase/epimerase
MLKLAAFADEISPDLGVQLDNLKKNGVTHIELRGVAGKNVLDFDKAMQKDIKARAADAGIGIACIGSPIGKVKLGEPFEKHFDRFKLAVELAEFFDAPMIRIFSYYPAEGTSYADFLKGDRAEVLKRLEKQAAYVENYRPLLVHENEKDIYGEKGPQCLDIHQSIQAPKLKAAFDFANFVQAGDDPAVNWPVLKKYVVHIHIKDALKGSGKVVPAGQGDGGIPAILKDAYASGYRGFLTLEPHLKVAGHSSGETGPELFTVAVDALRKICREQGIPLAS